MNRVVHNLATAPMFLLVFSGAWGCIDEDDSDCPEGLYLRFIPENPKHDFSGLVQCVDLYFYDETGTLAARFNYDRQELRPGDGAAYADYIPSGDYTLVSVINDVETYRTVNEEYLGSLQSYLVEKMSRVHLTDFFSGVRDITVDRKVSRQEEPAHVFKHNNDIRLEIILDGYEIPQGSSLTGYVEGNNGAYDYLAGACPGGCFRTYLPHREETGRCTVSAVFDFTVMRLWRDCDLTICLEQKDRSLSVTRSQRLNIADQLAQVKNEEGEFLYDTDRKLSFHDEYIIAMTLDADFVIVRLSVNDWAVIGKDIEV